MSIIKINPEKLLKEQQQEKYNPNGFLIAISNNANFEIWMDNFSSYKQTVMANTATKAAIDNDWSFLQSLYDQSKTAFLPTEAQRTEWQAIADDNSIPISF